MRLADPPPLPPPLRRSGARARRGGSALVLAACALLGCGRRAGESGPPAPVLRAARPSAQDTPQPAVTDAATLASADAAMRAAEPAPAQSSSPAPHARVALARVAALRADVVLAVGDDALYRLAGGRWVRVPMAGASPRDVIATRGALWVLARGTGSNAGLALVARTRTVDDLQVVGAATLTRDSDPRALAVVREDDFWIGGARPALIHVVGGEYETPRVTEPVTELYRYRDETVLALHGNQRATTVRYGERHELPLDEDFLATFTDAQGTAYTAHLGGQIARGRPGHEYAAVTSPTPGFSPRVAAVLANGHLAVAGAGGPFATWEHHAWVTVAGAFPSDPIAILATTPPMVVGRGGEVVAVEGGQARVAVAR